MTREMLDLVRSRFFRNAEAALRAASFKRYG